MERFYGNAQVQETLHQMLKRDRAAHGFLFTEKPGWEKDAGKAVPGRTALHRGGKALRCLQILPDAGGRRASGCALCGTQRKAWRILGGYGA